jgi:hypothetical protein
VQLAGDDVRDLISASQKICYNLALKNSRKCNVRELIEKMSMLPEIVTDLQASSARGAARMALAMCLCRYPDMDLNATTTAVPDGCDSDKALEQCNGYDTRIASYVRHDQFYDKVVVPEDEAAEERKMRESAAEDPEVSDDNSNRTWTSSKSPAKTDLAGDATASSPAKKADE